jgi:Sec7-like guanine-nucleotide exchange factor
VPLIFRTLEGDTEMYANMASCLSQVKKRMTIEEFVRNNRGINEKVVMEEGRERKVPEDLPRTLLMYIYTNIQV